MEQGTIDTARQHLREAVYYLTSCWDALNAAEDALRVDVGVEDIDVIAGGVQDPSEAFKLHGSELDTVIAAVVTRAQEGGEAEVA